MVTHWRTEPIMDPRSRVKRHEQHAISRPQIYVHVEFGVSWSARHQPRNHQMSYATRNVRERGSFPRQVPPANTNYLQAPIPVPAPLPAPGPVPAPAPRSHRPRHYQQPQQQPAPPPQYQVQHQHQYAQHQQQFRPSHNIREYYQPHPNSYQVQRPQQQPQQQQPMQVPQLQQPPRRKQSRQEASDDQHDRERGSSAPPPINSSPWDLQVGNSTQATAKPAESQEPHSQQSRAFSAEAGPSIWKDLPETPARFRLGEEGMPWSAMSWPAEYGYDNGEDELTDREEDEEEEDGMTEGMRSNARNTQRFLAVKPELSTDSLCMGTAEYVGTDSRYFGTMDTTYSVADYPASPDAMAIPPGHLPPDATPLEQTRQSLPPRDDSLIREPQRRTDRSTRELEELGHAMMTVDNGFENQWWNQGPRQPTRSMHEAELLQDPVHPSTDYSVQSPQRRSLGWAIASDDDEVSPETAGVRGTGRAGAAANTLVSPLTDYGTLATTASLTDYGTMPVYQQLNRTLSTRSEELFLYQ